MKRPLPPRGLTQGVPPAALVGPEELARDAGFSEIVRLGSNESPYGPPPRAWIAMERALNDAHRYGDPSNHDLKEALAARHRVHPDNITIGAGIDDLLRITITAYLPPETTAVAALGGFPTFEMHAIEFRSRLQRVPYLPSGLCDLDGMLAAAHAGGGGIIYLANPDNPTGSHYGRADVERFVAALPDRTLLIHDEAYANFLPANERLPDGEPDPRVLRMRTFSKEYGMAGLRIGYAIGSREAIAAIEAIRLLYGVNRIALAGALAALGDDDFIAEAIAKMIEGRREYAVMGAQLGLPVFPSSTNFVLFDCGSAERAGTMLRELLVHGIHVRKPPAPPIDHCIRVSTGTPAQRVKLREALQTIAAVV